MNRVVVVGSSGVGKSTFAKNLAGIIAGDYLELDRLCWMPNWEQRSDEESNQVLSEFLQAERWVVDGNYSRFRDRVWQDADAVIWLNYPYWLNAFRLLKRTIQRVWQKQEVFEGCRESFRSQFLSKDSLLLWFIKTYGPRKQAFERIFAENQYPHLTVFEFKHPREAAFFLAALEEGDSIGS